MGEGPGGDAGFADAITAALAMSLIQSVKPMVPAGA